MAKIRKRNDCSGLAGQFYVAGELSRMEYSMGLTLGNTHVVDLMAHKNGKCFAIQVKTTRQRNNWMLGKRDLVDKNVNYVLVFLPNDLKKPPEFYVLH